MEKEARIKLQLEEREFNQKIRDVSIKAGQAFGTLKALERAGKVGVKVNGIDKLQALKTNYDNLKKKIDLLNKQKLRVQSGAAVGDLQKIENELLNTKIKFQSTQTALKNFHLPKEQKQSVKEAFNDLGASAKSLGIKFRDAFENVAKKSLTVLAGALTAAIPKAAEYETGISKLGTVTGLSIQKNRELADTISNISFKNQTNSVEALEGAYQGFSASLFSSKADVEKIMPSLEQMGKIGFTDLTSAIDLTSTAANAFGLKGQEVNKVMDQFVQVQNKGKTTVGELAASFGKIAPAANLIKVPVNEVNAAYIQMTKNGINTAESTTRLASLFGEFAKPGKELQGAIDKAGISLTQFEKNGGTLPQYFQLLMQKTGMSVDELSKLFGTKEAMAAFSTIAKDNFSGINQAMQDVSNSSGAVQNSFNQWQQTIGGKIDKVKNTFNEFLKVLGEDAINQIMPFIDAMAKLKPEEMKEYADKILEVGKAIGIAFVVNKISSFGVETAKTLRQMIGLVSQVASVFTALAASETAASIAAGILDALLSPFTLTIMAIVAVGTALYAAYVTNFGGFADFVNGMWSKVKEYFQAFLDWAGGFFKGLGDFFTSAWDTVSGAAKWTWDSIVGIVKAAWDTIVSVINTVMEPIKYAIGVVIDVAKNVWDTVVGVAKAAWDKIVTVIRVVMEPIKFTIGLIIAIVKVTFDAVVGIVQVAWNVIKGIWEFAKPFFEVLWNAIKVIFEVVWNIIKGIMTGVWEAVKVVWGVASKFFGVLWEGVKAIFSTVWNIIKGIMTGVWESVKVVWGVASKFFGALWDGVKVIFTTAWNILKGIVTGVWDAIKFVWSGVSKFFEGLWNGVKKVTSFIWDGIKKIFGPVWDFIKKIFEPVMNFFSGIWNSIYKVLKVPIDSIKNAFSNAWNSIKKVWNGIPDFFSGLWDSVVDGVKNIGPAIWNAMKNAFQGLRKWIGKEIRSIPVVGNSIAKVLGFATGGVLPAFTPVSINEIGQESIRMGSQVIYPSGNSYIADQVGQRVITAEQTKRNEQDQQPSNNIVFNITVNEAEDPEQTIRLIKRELRNLNL